MAPVIERGTPAMDSDAEVSNAWTAGDWRVSSGGDVQCRERMRCSGLGLGFLC
ncbi:hypothetical protein ES319_D03G022100v1 [Gossypium barbadense]|uniref:Uncharacterized protein n=1 Tax=Gossypium barbadense TaxID=3634 RepID=A0A5J5S2M0_GOSBA|nr:hypothetical protein ES319_D03G022100v1 [Gossypium barbadense]